jgi:hypothetical protein
MRFGLFHLHTLTTVLRVGRTMSLTHRCHRPPCSLDPSVNAGAACKGFAPLTLRPKEFPLQIKEGFLHQIHTYGTSGASRRIAIPDASGYHKHTRRLETAYQIRLRCRELRRLVDVEELSVRKPAYRQAGIECKRAFGFGLISNALRGSEPDARFFNVMRKRSSPATALTPVPSPALRLVEGSSVPPLKEVCDGFLSPQRSGREVSASGGRSEAGGGLRSYFF